MMGMVVLPSVLLLLILLQPMRLVGVSRCLDACAVCSSANGCLSCLPGFFFLLQREGLRQRGHCLRRCPPGHFEKHRMERSVCARCRVPDCAQCFGVGSCTMCSPGYVLLQGSCLSTCPHGLQPDAHNVECTPIDAVTKRRGKKAGRSGRNRCLKRRWEKSMGE